MRGNRYDRILAGTALTLVLTLASAQAQPDLLEAKMPLPEQSVVPPPTAADVTGTPGNSSATGAATPSQATPSQATPSQATPSQPTPSDSAVAAPEPAPDPLASLDPADRPIAEKMRDLLAAKVDRIFP